MTKNMVLVYITIKKVVIMVVGSKINVKEKVV